jgi:hypothetical protein
MFLSIEVVISCLMWYAAWHCNIAIHEMGHYLAAVKTNNLRPELADRAAAKDEPGGAWPLDSGISKCLSRFPTGPSRGSTKRGETTIPPSRRRIWRFPRRDQAASKVLSQLCFLPGIVLILLGIENRCSGLRSTLGRAAVHDRRGGPVRFPACGCRKVQGLPGEAAEAAAKAAEVKAAEPVQARRMRAPASPPNCGASSGCTGFRN